VAEGRAARDATRTSHDMGGGQTIVSRPPLHGADAFAPNDAQAAGRKYRAVNILSLSGET